MTVRHNGYNGNGLHRENSDRKKYKRKMVRGLQHGNSKCKLNVEQLLLG